MCQAAECGDEDQCAHCAGSRNGQWPKSETSGLEVRDGRPEQRFRGATYARRSKAVAPQNEKTPA